MQEKAEWRKGIKSWREKKQYQRFSSGFQYEQFPKSDGSQHFPADPSTISHQQSFLKCLCLGLEEIDA